MKKPTEPVRRQDFKIIGKIPTGNFYDFLAKLQECAIEIEEKGYTEPFLGNFSGIPEIQVKATESDEDFDERNVKYLEDLEFYKSKTTSQRRKLYDELRLEFETEE